MIKNIILDMGNVITEFSPIHFVGVYAKGEADKELLVDLIFGSAEYKQLDLGNISYAEATEIWVRRCPRLEKPIRLISDHWFEHKELVVPINQLALLLKKRGLGLYLLSNASDKFSLYRDKVPALHILDGAVLSYEEHCCKPNEQIYRTLFSRYGLKPEECYFVDDSPANIEAGRKLGMDGFVFPKDVDSITATKELLDALKMQGIAIKWEEVERISFS